uniref:Uncharacterized protein n=1 Tax=Rhizophora mucronata TaxID=61149 RepID=A0A2P2P7R4_RHIMU
MIYPKENLFIKEENSATVIEKYQLQNFSLLFTANN